VVDVDILTLVLSTSPEPPSLKLLHCHAFIDIPSLTLIQMRSAEEKVDPPTIIE
jgi:hypothetical protein